MATLAEVDKKNMLNVISDVPLNFVHSSTTYTAAATMGSLVKNKPLETGGLFDEPDLTITTTLQKLDTDGTTLVNRFSTAPAAKDLVTVDGTQYRVDSTVEDELTSALVLNLISKHR